MSVKEFARRAEFTLSIAYALTKEGRVPYRRIGKKGRRGKITISEGGLIEFLKSCEVGQEVK